jgi:hypothetical protein
MDYQKAFDTVPYRRILHKLEAYSIGKETTEWIRDYLTDMKQHVAINNSASVWHGVTSEIPQGSCSARTNVVHNLHK